MERKRKQGKRKAAERKKVEEARKPVVNQRCRCFLPKNFHGKIALPAARLTIQPSLRSVLLPDVDLLGNFYASKKLPRKSCTP